MVGEVRTLHVGLHDDDVLVLDLLVLVRLVKRRQGCSHDKKGKRCVHVKRKESRRSPLAGRTGRGAGEHDSEQTSAHKVVGAHGWALPNAC